MARAWQKRAYVPTSLPTDGMVGGILRHPTDFPNKIQLIVPARPRRYERNAAGAPSGGIATSRRLLRARPHPAFHAGAAMMALPRAFSSGGVDGWGGSLCARESNTCFRTMCGVRGNIMRRGGELARRPHLSMDSRYRPVPGLGPRLGSPVLCIRVGLGERQRPPTPK